MNIKAFFFITVIFLFFTTNSKASVRDTIAELSNIKGADMTIYELYLQYRETDRDLAIQYAETFVNNTDTASRNTILAQLCEKISDYYGYRRFIYSKAIPLRERALKIYNSCKMERSSAIVKYELSKLLVNTNRYDTALKYSIEALEYFKKTGELKYILECYNILGIVYYICEDFPTSNTYFRKYAEGARELKDSVKLLLAINNSSLYTSNIANDTTKTRQLIRESIRLASILNDSTYMYSMYFNLANSYLASEQTDKAYGILEKCDSISRTIKEKGRTAYLYGSYYIMKRQYSKAIEAFNESIRNLSEGELDNDIKKSLLTLQYAYSCTGDYRNAYKTIMHYYDIDNKSSESSFKDLFRAQNDIINQKKQEEFKRHQDRQTFFISAGTLSLVIIFLLIYFHFRKKAIIISKKETELENTRLLQEKMEQEIKSRNEIMEIKRIQQYQTDKLVEDIIDKMEKIETKITDKEIRNEIKGLCSNIRHSKSESQWKEMNQFIPEFNSTFFNNLIKDYPDLSINERRLCALLNLNMTTKEISEITKQSVHSINIARGRLRNKLGLTGSNETLQEFLARYSQNN